MSDAVVRQIELLILRGVLRPGERLPPERDLAERLGVSRPSLRDALADLQARGLLCARAGSGVYVAEMLGSAFSPPLVRLFASHDEALFDFVAFRRDLEGLAAERAAQFGSDTDLQVVATVFGRMEAAHMRRSAADEARLDAEFHLSIVEASHNLIMLHMMRAMFELLREGVFYNRQAMFRRRATRETLLEQHRAINSAVQARQPETARAAVHAHLDFVERALQDLRLEERHESIARQRAEHARSL